MDQSLKGCVPFLIFEQRTRGHFFSNIEIEHLLPFIHFGNCSNFILFFIKILILNSLNQAAQTNNHQTKRMQFFRFPFLILMFFLSVDSIGQTTNTGSDFFTIPPYFIANSECYIQGPLDGDGSNTIICFENNRNGSFGVKPIIESKNKLLIKIPEIFGEYELIIVDEGNNVELFTPVRIVQLKTTYKMNDSNDKLIDIEAQLLGAEHLDAEFTLSIENRTPHIVSIINGNKQKHTVKGNKNSTKVSWQGQMRAIDKADFYIEFLLEQPNPSIQIPLYN